MCVKLERRYQRMRFRDSSCVKGLVEEHDRADGEAQALLLRRLMPSDIGANGNARAREQPNGPRGGAHRRGRGPRDLRELSFSSNHI